MPEYGLSLNRILPYKDRIVEYGWIRVSENPYSRDKIYKVFIIRVKVLCEWPVV